MIKLFRNIRQNLLAEGKTTKYFKYAIGEIILVVIGILIALQINNWNIERNNRALEKTVLKQIHAEFLDNKSQLNNTYSIHKRTVESCEWLLDRYPFQKENLDSLRKHLVYSKFAWTFNPSQSSIESLVNNGNLDIIRDVELRNALMNWKELVNDYIEEELINRKLSEDIMFPFDIKNFKMYTSYESRFDEVLNFDAQQLDEFLNIITTRKRLVNQIINGDEQEYQAVTRSINLIVSKTKAND